MKHILLGAALHLLLAFPVFAQETSSSFAVGIAIDDQTFSKHIGWFKAGMAEFGYIEGENVRYLFYGFIENEARIDERPIDKTGSDRPDIIIVMGNYSALWAKKTLEGTDIPALFSTISCDPISKGIVESLSRPKGNITGIRVSNSVPKALEWLVAAVPGARKISLPYDPADNISMLAMNGLPEAAHQLGIELVVQEVYSVEAAVAAIEALPEDIDALFRIPSQTFELREIELNQAAGRRNLPVGSATSLKEEVLITFSPDFERTGVQTARLAHKILRGANPSDLPIETTEVILTVNLKIAQKLGIHVPDTVLVNANTIIR